MRGIRDVLMRHRALALACLALALMVRVLVPAGYMTQAGTHDLEVRICSDSTSSTASSYRLTIPVREDGSSKSDAQHVKGTCAFSPLGHAALGAVDPVLLALAILFILALGYRFRPAIPLASCSNIRPPVRGPPRLN